MIRLDIHNWRTSAFQFRAQIDCAEDAPESVKRALAACWAVENNADLTNANLTGADLMRANLTNAKLIGANLTDANLTRANLTGTCVRVVGGRSDGCAFVMQQQPDGPPILWAGRRSFTIHEAREHWTSTRAGTELGEESLALCDHAERLAKIAGWL